jgi:O-antigen ligase
VLGLSLLFILLFSLSTDGRTYLTFYDGLVNIFNIFNRLHDPASSEGGRLASILHSLQLWKQHFILGNGVSTLPGKEAGLGQLAENTWVELPVESGLLGLLAFLWALFRTLRQAFKLNKDVEAGILLGACLLAHFLVNLNFTATFPRLDYWILFFFCVHLLRRQEPA